ncbi:MAG: hypothetical protein U1E53_15960 [Dongiaceae bacterium]
MAAAANGFRLARGVERGWRRFASTTADVAIWIGGASPAGPWLLSVDRPEVIAEIGVAPAAGGARPGAATFVLDSLGALHAALDRVYRLGVWRGRSLCRTKAKPSLAGMTRRRPSPSRR